MKKLFLTICFILITNQAWCGNIDRYRFDGTYVTTVFTLAKTDFEQLMYMGGNSIFANICTDLATPPVQNFQGYLAKIRMVDSAWKLLKISTLLPGTIYLNRGLSTDGKDIYRHIRVLSIPPRVYTNRINLDTLELEKTVSEGVVFWLGTFFNGVDFFVNNGQTSPDTLHAASHNNANFVLKGSGVTLPNDGYVDFTYNDNKIYGRRNGSVDIIKRDGTLIRTLTISGNGGITTDGVHLFIGV